MNKDKRTKTKRDASDKSSTRSWMNSNSNENRKAKQITKIAKNEDKKNGIETNLDTLPLIRPRHWDSRRCRRTFARHRCTPPSGRNGTGHRRGTCSPAPVRRSFPVYHHLLLHRGNWWLCRRLRYRPVVRLGESVLPAREEQKVGWEKHISWSREQTQCPVVSRIRRSALPGRKRTRNNNKHPHDTALCVCFGGR